ncbi:hypothetical protein D3C78_1356440 [compost metagenome]
MGCGELFAIKIDEHDAHAKGGEFAGGGKSDAGCRTCYDSDIIFLECGVDGRHRFLLRVVSAVSSGLQRCLNLGGFIHGLQVDRAAL